MTVLFRSVTLSHSVSDVCTRHLIPAFCHLTFPLCVGGDGGVVGDVTSQQQVRSLCPQDCLMLETEYCRAEYTAATRSHQQGA